MPRVAGAGRERTERESPIPGNAEKPGRKGRPGSKKRGSSGEFSALVVGERACRSGGGLRGTGASFAGSGAGRRPRAAVARIRSDRRRGGLLLGRAGRRGARGTHRLGVFRSTSRLGRGDRFARLGRHALRPRCRFLCILGVPVGPHGDGSLGIPAIHFVLNGLKLAQLMDRVGIRSWRGRSGRRGSTHGDGKRERKDERAGRQHGGRLPERGGLESRRPTAPREQRFHASLPREFRRLEEIFVVRGRKL